MHRAVLRATDAETPEDRDECRQIAEAISETHDSKAYVPAVIGSIHNWGDARDWPQRGTKRHKIFFANYCASSWLDSLLNQIKPHQHIRQDRIELRRFLEHQPMAHAVHAAVIGLRRKPARVSLVVVVPHRVRGVN